MAAKLGQAALELRPAARSPSAMQALEIKARRPVLASTSGTEIRERIHSVYWSNDSPGLSWLKKKEKEKEKARERAKKIFDF